MINRELTCVIKVDNLMVSVIVLFAFGKIVKKGQRIAAE